MKERRNRKLYLIHNSSYSRVWAISILSSFRRLVLVIFRSLETDVLNLRKSSDIFWSKGWYNLLLLLLKDSLSCMLPRAFLILLTTFPLHTRTKNTKKPYNSKFENIKVINIFTVRSGQRSKRKMKMKD